MKFEWKVKNVGELTKYISKGIPPKYTNKASDSTIIVLNQKCNRNFKISYSEAQLHDQSQKSVSQDKMLCSGDVLINSTGTGTAGRVAQIIDLPSPTTVDGHMIILRPTNEIEPLYYGYAIKSLQSKIETLAEGSTGQTEINRQRLCDEVFISYPVSKEMQHQISLVFFHIDEKIALNTAINENLASKTQNLFFSAVRSAPFVHKRWQLPIRRNDPRQSRSRQDDFLQQAYVCRGCAKALRLLERPFAA